MQLNTSEDYKSYFVEVEPGMHVLEVGTGYPVFMQRQSDIWISLSQDCRRTAKDRVRLIMPTMVGLGFSSKVPASRHTVDNHMRWINSVLVQLQLTELRTRGRTGVDQLGWCTLTPGLSRVL